MGAAGSGTDFGGETARLGFTIFSSLISTSLADENVAMHNGVVDP
jgi:hypothetical protein